MGANIKEINTRIRSVKNTQQITRAMNMVAAAKLRRAQERLLASRPYGEKLNLLMEGLSGTRIDHAFFEEREVEKLIVVIVSSDKGLCGSYNATILRDVEKWLGELPEDGPEIELYLVGRKAGEFFKRRRWTIHTVIDDLGGTIDLTRFNQIADDLIRMYLTNETQEIILNYTRFISTLSSTPESIKLLPMVAEGDEDEEAGSSVDYIYEPSAESVLAEILPKSLRNKVYNCLAEAFTSEHGARMTSMGAATENAGELIDSLVLFRNRARQAAITQEISEIVGGSDALG